MFSMAVGIPGTFQGTIEDSGSALKKYVNTHYLPSSNAKPRTNAAVWSSPYFA